MIPMIIEIVFKKYVYSNFDESIGSLSKVLFFSFLSKVILKIKIYKHQLVSLIVISLNIIGILILEIINTKNNIEKIKMIISVIYYIFTFALYALYDVLVKRHFNVYFDISYHLMFFIGLFSIILIVPYELITYFFFTDKDFVKDGIIKELIVKINESNLYFLWLFLDILINFFWIGGIILILYFFTPCHFITSDSLSHLLTMCINLIKEDGDSLQTKWITIIFYSVIILFSLIYNEIIIINICSMGKNTAKYINKRQKIEMEDTEEIINGNFDDTTRISKNRTFSEDEEI